MKNNAFALLEHGWPAMDETQWSQHLRAFGEPSQKQRRKLVESSTNFNNRRIHPHGSEESKAWLHRFIGSMRNLSLHERNAWWNNLIQYPQAMSIALERGLSFHGMSSVAVDQILSNLSTRSSGNCYMAWNLLGEDDKCKSISLVLPGLMACPREQWLDQWLPELSRLAPWLSQGYRVNVVSGLMEHAVKACDDGLDEDRDMVGDLLDLFAPPHLQMLTQIVDHCEDPWNILPPRVAAEDRHRIDQSTGHAKAATRAVRF